MKPDMGLDPLPGFLPAQNPYLRRKLRCWTRSQALQLMTEWDGPASFGGWPRGRKLSLTTLTKIMLKLGYVEFRLFEDHELSNPDQG